MIDWDLSADDLPASDRSARRSAPTATQALKDSTHADLRPIPFTAFAVTPLPETWESDTEFAWLEFDAATVSMDLATQTGRTEYAELMATQTDRWPRA